MTEDVSLMGKVILVGGMKEKVKAMFPHGTMRQIVRPRVQSLHSESYALQTATQSKVTEEAYLQMVCDLSAQQRHKNNSYRNCTTELFGRLFSCSKFKIKLLSR